ncbi:hypothetical protein AAC387_Pa07g1262 [Persea americana]
MQRYVQPLHTLFHFTWRFCIFLREWSVNRILRLCRVLVKPEVSGCWLHKSC